MSEQNYRRALGAVVTVCILLASVLAYVISHRDHPEAVAKEDDTVVARGPETTAKPMQMKSGTSADSTPGLMPVQLSPQRLQAIGITTALVEMRPLNDELRVPGNV